MLKCISSTPVRTVKPTALPKYVRMLSEHHRPDGDGGMAFSNTLRPSSYTVCQDKSVAWIHKKKSYATFGLLLTIHSFKSDSDWLCGAILLHEVDTLNISSLLCFLTRVKSGYVDVFLMRKALRPVCVCVGMFMWFMRTQICIMTWVWHRYYK